MICLFCALACFVVSIIVRSILIYKAYKIALFLFHVNRTAVSESIETEYDYLKYLRQRGCLRFINHYFNARYWYLVFQFNRWSISSILPNNLLEIFSDISELKNRHKVCS